MAIPDNLIGSILGRGGRTLTELQALSDTRIRITQRGEYLPGTKSRVVRGGMTADAAIDTIYAIYGHQTCITIIVNRIRKQKNDGTLNPNLRI